jgi:myo-inositol-1(or 4)-monophosphatase
MVLSLLQTDQIRFKSSQKDLVTKYDVEVQDFLESRFHELWPDRHFMGEEQDEYRYEQRGDLVDPIDGTSNFIFGIPHFCISVAVLEQDEIVQEFSTILWRTRCIGPKPAKALI